MDLISLLHNPTQLALAWIALAVVSAAVRALPEPTTGSRLFYRWFYGFAHALPVNWDCILKAITPRSVPPLYPPINK